jgi:stearoyl-CoA desaturase (delta-9 desaturase)
MKPREWVAIHRKHHAYTDKEGDPHSPKIHGFWSVQIGNLFLYLKEKRRMTEKGEIRLYAADIKEDAWDRWLFNHGLLGVSLGTLILCILLGFWQGLLAAGLHFILYVFILSSSINGLCHTMGHKNYDNTAFNIQWLAYFTGGESLHNNHHGKQRNPKFSHRHGEVDPAWPVIRLLMMLGLAWPSNK